jgi:hypothetical protein
VHLGARRVLVAVGAMGARHAMRQTPRIMNSTSPGHRQDVDARRGQDQSLRSTFGRIIRNRIRGESENEHCDRWKIGAVGDPG